jgi:hypothetical protein
MNRIHSYRQTSAEVEEYWEPSDQSKQEPKYLAGRTAPEAAHPVKKYQNSLLTRL